MSKKINDLADKLSFYTPPAVSVSSSSTTVPAAESRSVMESVKGLFGGAASQPPAQNDEESAGLMSWASAKISSAKSSVDDISSTRERLTTFAIIAAAGAICMILAFTFLPFVIISPHKFALLFTIGSALMVISFSFLRGHVEFVKHLSSVQRLPFSVSYGVSLIGTLYCSLVMGSYLLTLVFSIVQVVALAYFLVSYIPGGTGALTFVGGVVGSGIKSIVVR